MVTWCAVPVFWWQAKIARAVWGISAMLTTMSAVCGQPGRAVGTTGEHQRKAKRSTTWTIWILAGCQALRPDAVAYWAAGRSMRILRTPSWLVTHGRDRLVSLDADQRPTARRSPAGGCGVSARGSVPAGAQAPGRGVVDGRLVANTRTGGASPPAPHLGNSGGASTASA